MFQIKTPKSVCGICHFICVQMQASLTAFNFTKTANCAGQNQNIHTKDVTYFFHDLNLKKKSQTSSSKESIK